MTSPSSAETSPPEDAWVSPAWEPALPEDAPCCPPHAASDNARLTLNVTAAHFFNIIPSPLLLNFYVFSYMIYLKPSRICSRSSMSSGIVTR